MQRTLLAYWVVAGLALLLQVASDDRLRAFGLGLAFPGAGFLHWAGALDDSSSLALLLAAGTAGLFLLSLFVWFGTGNILLPPMIWLASAFAAANAGQWLGAAGRGPIRSILEAGLPLALCLAIAMATIALRRRARPPAEVDLVSEKTGSWRGAAAPSDRPTELDPVALRLMALVLDRAQQPIPEFNGFEWRDQFQTAAIRYQVNFLSYALAMVQANHLPAAGAYLASAQENLLAKLGDHRLWRYWALENAWGRLRLGADPVPADNIMFSGFAAAQIVLAQNAGTALGPLRLRPPRGDDKSYGLDHLVGLLAEQYACADFGLLACEPNWIYPLCNAITASAIKGFDARAGTDVWAGLAPKFRHGLLTEFVTASGDIVSFRSSVSGLAPPAIGGAVMQAFPSLFLNGLFPDLAETQWQRLRGTVARHGLERAFWPIDVGNYGFSRASSYAASAAAAVEMGDAAMAARLLSALEAECPATAGDGAWHRPRASLWAHALELTARAGRRDGLRDLVCISPVPVSGPQLHEVRHPEILVARAVAREGGLEAVLHPGKRAGPVRIGLSGLTPDRCYALGGAAAATFRADAQGRGAVDLVLDGRTEFLLRPAA